MDGDGPLVRYIVGPNGTLVPVTGSVPVLDEGCGKLSMPDFPLSPLTYKSPVASFESLSGFTSADADPIIGRHAVHWLLCGESYSVTRRYYIEGWYLVYNDLESCVYRKGCGIIFAFRGTKDARDLYDDSLISMGKEFPRSVQAGRFVSEFLRLNPVMTVEVTGHSLGGAVAREVGERLGLKTVTFNAAAPPSSPVTVAAREVSYHVQFDIISAWQSPGVVRIDKGYWPVSGFFSSMIPFAWVWHVLSGVIPSHSLVNFSMQRVGVIVSAAEEDVNMRRWFGSLPVQGRVYILMTLMGMGGEARATLPTIS